MFRNDPRGADNLCGGVWNSQKWVESLAQDQHRARVYFGLILAAVISGLSAAVIAFAAQGPALRWLVVGVAFVAGACSWSHWSGSRESQPPKSGRRPPASEQDGR